MKNNNACTIDHVNTTIVMTRKFYRAACLLNTPEYNELMKIRHDNPAYTMKVIDPKKPANKNTYNNLTVKNMRLFVENSKQDTRPQEERLREFDEACGLAKAYPSKYAVIKSWFLKNYGKEYNQFREDKNEEAA